MSTYKKFCDKTTSNQSFFQGRKTVEVNCPIEYHMDHSYGIRINNGVGSSVAINDEYDYLPFGL